MKKRTLVRIIDAVVVSGIIVGIFAYIGSNVLKSKKEYDIYYNETYDPIFTAKPLSMSAKVKDGVTYFNNNLAKPKPEDFEVKVKFLRGDVENSYFMTTLDYQKHPYKIKTQDEYFYKNGGKITITYKDISTEIDYELVDVELVNLEVVSDPYKVVYKSGEVFDSNGLELKAIFNDGSTKLIEENECSFDSKNITNSTKEIIASYSQGDITKTTPIPIKISETVNDTTFASMRLKGNVYCLCDNTFDNLTANVVGVYESGNSKLLSKSEYFVKDGTELAIFGRKYEKEIVLTSNNSISLKTAVIISNKIEAESMTFVGGSKKTEEEYYQGLDGKIISSGISTTFVGDFAKTVQAGKTAYLKANITSENDTKTDITFRCSNSYCVQNASKQYLIKPLQINTICDIYVNYEDGKEEQIEINDNVVLKGCGPNSTYAPLFGIYNEFVLQDVTLKKGVNGFTLSFKSCTDKEAVNCWGESPSTLNVDFVRFDTLGK